MVTSRRQPACSAGAATLTRKLKELDIPLSLREKRFPSRLEGKARSITPRLICKRVSFQAPCLEWQAFQPDSQKVPHD